MTKIQILWTCRFGMMTRLMPLKFVKDDFYSCRKYDDCTLDYDSPPNYNINTKEEPKEDELLQGTDVMHTKVLIEVKLAIFSCYILLTSRTWKLGIAQNFTDKMDTNDLQAVCAYDKKPEKDNSLSTGSTLIRPA